MAKYNPQPLSQRDTAKLMGLGPKTDILHFGQEADDTSPPPNQQWRLDPVTSKRQLKS